MSKKKSNKTVVKNTVGKVDEKNTPTSESDTATDTTDKNECEKKEKFKLGLIPKIALYTVEFIQIILMAVFFVYFDTMGMWPIKYMVYILIGILVVFVVCLVLKRWKWGCVLSFILSLILIIIAIIGNYYIYKTHKTLDQITENVNVKTNIICTLVLKGDVAENINDARDYNFGVLGTIDRENTDSTISRINEELGQSIFTTEYDNILSLANALISKEVNAIIINNAYVDIIADYEGYEDFEEKIKSIYANVIRTEIIVEEEEEEEEEEVEKAFEITRDPFNVYISGIDTTGNVTTQSRSDVNIIMSINPTTKQILLLSTPRDYYVELSNSNGIKDKLTHAGLYGIDVSMETLEMLYGIEIDYYIRMNFTGFTDIINALGGIEVYSDYAFNAKGYYYNKGYNNLTGEAALHFARERKSFASGDNQRGKNQMAVIEGVIAKATSSALLNDYTTLLESISDSMQTNMNKLEIAKLVKMQLDSGSEWNVVSESVTGKGRSEYTFSIPSAKAYVMEPDMETVAKAKELLHVVWNGEILDKEE